MRLTVRAFGDLRKMIGHEFEVELDRGARVGDLLRSVGAKAGSPDKLVSKEGKIAEHLSVLVNGLSINVGEGVEEELRDGDVISLLPPAGGG